MALCDYISSRYSRPVYIQFEAVLLTQFHPGKNLSLVYLVGTTLHELLSEISIEFATVNRYKVLFIVRIFMVSLEKNFSINSLKKVYTCIILCLR